VAKVVERERVAAETAERERLAREMAAAAEAETAASTAVGDNNVEAAAPGPTTGLPRILLVDDEASMRSWLRMQLERSGWLVEEAEDGPTALQRFDTVPASVVVLDEYMPGMRGLDVARELRSRDTDVTLLLFSASVDPEVIAEANRLEVHFMSKINLDLLLQHLELLQATLARAV
jgi:CheY-like chemotaxis protein